jgi:hypothetical protein
MADPNCPLRMKRRGDSARPRVLDNGTGNAGLDGYTRIARRERPNEYGYAPGDLSPAVGERDYSHGYRFSEDY